jgi:hypothetical protein
MRVRGNWIGYDVQDVERTEQALNAELHYLDVKLTQELVRLRLERDRSRDRLAELKEVLDRCLEEEQRLLAAIQDGIGHETS